MIRTILVATDGSDHAKRAVSLASEIAVKFNSHLILAHILLSNVSSNTLRSASTLSRLPKKMRSLMDTYEGDFQIEIAASGAPVGFASPPPPRELVRVVGKQIIEHAEKAAAKAGVIKITPLTLDGDAADVILEVGAYHKANMIVVGSRGLSDFRGLLLGSVSHKVSARAECPCLTVK